MSASALACKWLHVRTGTCGRAIVRGVVRACVCACGRAYTPLSATVRVRVSALCVRGTSSACTLTCVCATR
eukprot:6192187-Pleurochrysis_carterae.AAC.1